LAVSEQKPPVTVLREGRREYANKAKK